MDRDRTCADDDSVACYGRRVILPPPSFKAYESIGRTYRRHIHGGRPLRRVKLTVHREGWRFSASLEPSDLRLTSRHSGIDLMPHQCPQRTGLEEALRSWESCRQLRHRLQRTMRNAWGSTLGNMGYRLFGSTGGISFPRPRVQRSLLGNTLGECHDVMGLGRNLLCLAGPSCLRHRLRAVLVGFAGSAQGFVAPVGRRKDQPRH